MKPELCRRSSLFQHAHPGHNPRRKNGTPHQPLVCRRFCSKQKRKESTIESSCTTAKTAKKPKPSLQRRKGQPKDKQISNTPSLIFSKDTTKNSHRSNGEDSMDTRKEPGAAPAKQPTTNNSGSGRNARLLPLNFKPKPHAVVIGRGKEAKEFPVGNERLKALVAQLLQQYGNAKNRTCMSNIVSSVVSSVRGACAGGEGAFVKLDKDGRWYEVSEAAAREKVGYTFRDMLGDRYHSSSQSKVARKRQLRRNAAHPEETNDEESNQQRDDPSSSMATASLAATVYDYSNALLESSQHLTQATTSLEAPLHLGMNSMGPQRRQSGNVSHVTNPNACCPTNIDTMFPPDARLPISMAVGIDGRSLGGNNPRPHSSSINATLSRASKNKISGSCSSPLKGSPRLDLEETKNN